MKLHCRHTVCTFLPLLFWGKKRHKCIQVFLVSSTSRTGPLIVCQSLFHSRSACVCVSACYRERHRKLARQLNLESYRCSHQPHAMQQRFLPKAKGAEASDNRCERGSHNCRFSKCVHWEERRCYFWLIFQSQYIKQRNSSYPLLVIVICILSPLDLGLLLTASERLKLTGNKEFL